MIGISQFVMEGNQSPGQPIHTSQDQRFGHAVYCTSVSDDNYSDYTYSWHPGITTSKGTMITVL